MVIIIISTVLQFDTNIKCRILLQRLETRTSDQPVCSL